MALANSPNARFLGMDVGQWPGQWRAAAALLLRSPWLRGLTPAVRVRLRRPDGRTSLWDVAHGQAHAAPDADTACLAGLPPLAEAEVGYDDAPYGVQYWVARWLCD